MTNCVFMILRGRDFFQIKIKNPCYINGKFDVDEMRLLIKSRNIYGCENMSRKQLESLLKTLFASTSIKKSKKKSASKLRKKSTSQPKDKGNVLV